MTSNMAPALIGRRPGAASALEPERLTMVCCVQPLQVDGSSGHDDHSIRKKGENPVADRISAAVLTFVRQAEYGPGGLVRAFKSRGRVLACCVFSLFFVTHRGEAQTMDGSAPDGKATTA